MAFAGIIRKSTRSAWPQLFPSPSQAPPPPQPVLLPHSPKHGLLRRGEYRTKLRGLQSLNIYLQAVIMCHFRGRAEADQCEEDYERLLSYT